MISITVQPQSAAHIDVMAAAMKALLSSLTPPAVAPSQKQMDAAIEHAEVAKQEVQKSEAPKPVPAVATPSATEVPAPAETATASPSEDKPIDYATVKAAVMGLVKSKGGDVVAQLLGEFGVTKGPDLKVEQYAAVLARAKELA